MVSGDHHLKMVKINKVIKKKQNSVIMKKMKPV